MGYDFTKTHVWILAQLQLLFMLEAVNFLVHVLILCLMLFMLQLFVDLIKIRHPLGAYLQFSHIVFV